MVYEVNVDGKDHRLELARTADGWQCSLDGQNVGVDAALVRPDVLSLLVGDAAYEIKRELDAEEIYIWVGSTRHRVELRDPRSLRSRKSGAVDDSGPRKITAPMPGKVVRVLVREGDAVEAGAGVLVVEAMKMQNEIKSPKKGTVQKMLAAEGVAVNAGDVLAIVE